jgi:hypothetical protein
VQDEHFEDFTTASDWETFTARMEQTLTEWMGKPPEPENILNNWLVIHERISFSGKTHLSSVKIVIK